MRCLVCTQVRRAAERGGLDRSPLLYRLVTRYSIRPAAARRDGATDQRTRPRFLRFADGDARRKKMLRHTNAVLAQLPADQFTSRQASATDRDSPMERSGGPLDDTLRVQCVERFLCHFAGDAQKVLAPTNPLCVPNQCAARMYGSSPHQPITAFASVSDCRPSMQSSGLSHGARRNPPARRQHALARVSNSRASHWQAHAFGAVA